MKDLNVQVLSSTAIKVSWTPPPNADRLPLTYHVSYSSEFTSSTSRSTREQSLDLTSLHPFDVYNVSVEARNSRGRSGAVTREARTSSAGMRAMCVYHLESCMPSPIPHIVAVDRYNTTHPILLVSTSVIIVQVLFVC